MYTNMYIYPLLEFGSEATFVSADASNRKPEKLLSVLVRRFCPVKGVNITVHSVRGETFEIIAVSIQTYKITQRKLTLL
jgi:hypothetical protein